MANLPFPMSSTPARLTGEGEGRLLNCYTEKNGDGIVVRRVPGLVPYASTSLSGPRGMVTRSSDGVTLVAYANGVARIRASGSVSIDSGVVGGTGLVTFAINSNGLLSEGSGFRGQIAVAQSGGAWVIANAVVSPLTDTDLPSTVNSVSFMDGYFLFTIPDGRIFASGLNDTEIDALSFATAESKADGLVRGFVHGGAFYAAGTNTIEPWLNVGLEPFPLTRATSVIPIGLKSAAAIAGFEEGWDANPFFVAHDGTVHELKGYRTERVSTPAVEDFIARSTDAELEACCYTHRGHPIWALSSSLGTWCFDVGSRQWHERKSTGATRWRASRSVKVASGWLLGDTLSGNIVRVDDSVRTEVGQPVELVLESAALKGFPARASFGALEADFSMGRTGGSVSASWSRDGGATWSTPIARSLEPTVGPVRVNRLGLASHHGLRVRFTSTSSADFSFMGAALVPEPDVRAP
jgi:hypothetical protein